MAFIRKKKISGKDYFYYVESFKRGDAVFQKNLKYLGKDKPDDVGILELESEFTEKKIQKLIRSELKFDSFKVSNELLLKFDRLKIKFFTNVMTLSRVGKEQLIRRFKTGYTYHSCSIEGNTLSRAEVDLIINQHISIDGKRLLELEEVRGHKRAIEYMMSEMGDLSEDFIKRLHEQLMDGVLEFKEDDLEFVVGGYRCDMRFIEGADFIPPVPIEVVREMKKLIRFYKKNKYEIHPVELASEVHLRFVMIHPFSDGNGRMGRLLMNFILDRSGFPMIDISVENREEYIVALSSGDGAKLTKFIYTQLKKYVDALFKDSNGGSSDKGLSEWFGDKE